MTAKRWWSGFFCDVLSVTVDDATGPAGSLLFFNSRNVEAKKIHRGRIGGSITSDDFWRTIIPPLKGASAACA